MGKWLTRWLAENSAWALLPAVIGAVVTFVGLLRELPFGVALLLAIFAFLLLILIVRLCQDAWSWWNESRAHKATGLPSGSNAPPHGVQIHEAVWGVFPNGPRFDVTEVVRGRVKDGVLSMYATNKELGGNDPAFGIQKTLVIQWALDGVGQDDAFVPERDHVGLPPTKPLVPLAISGSTGTAKTYPLMGPYTGASAAFGAIASSDQAIAHIAKYRSELTGAKVIFFPVNQLPVATEIASIFELAGWKIDFTDTAQEPYNPDYREGIEVQGFTQVLVYEVAAGLRLAGYAGIRPVVDVLKVQKNNPKYPTSLNSIRVTIGHPPTQRGAKPPTSMVDLENSSGINLTRNRTTADRLITGRNVHDVTATDNIHEPRQEHREEEPAEESDSFVDAPRAEPVVDVAPQPSEADDDSNSASGGVD